MSLDSAERLKVGIVKMDKLSASKIEKKKKTEWNFRTYGRRTPIILRAARP